MALGLVAFYVRNVPWIAHLLSTDDSAEQEHDLAVCLAILSGHVASLLLN